MKELKYRIIINEEYLKKEFKLMVDMLSMSEEEIDEKFNEVLNDPDHKFLIKDIKRSTIARAYHNFDDDKLMEEVKRLDKSKSLKDLVYLRQKSQEEIKDMSLEEFIEYVD